MKKYVVALALLVAASGYSADEVYSANIVGFTKMTLEKGSRTIVGLPFNNGTDQVPSDVFGDQLPVGSTLYIKPKGEPYTIEKYTRVNVGTMFSPTYVTNWIPDTTGLSAGVGFWVEVAADALKDSYDVVFSGDVTAENDILSVSEGVNLIAYPYPVNVVWTNTALAESAVVGDEVYSWNGSTYEINRYARLNEGTMFDPVYVTNWTNPEMVLDVSKGFWYKTENQSIESVEEPVPYEL